jgi:hypothetical protein
MLKLPSCPEVQDHLTDYLEGALPFRKRAGFWLHLLVCEACRGLMNMIRLLPPLGKKALAPPETPDPGARKALDSALASIRRQPGP